MPIGSTREQNDVHQWSKSSTQWAVALLLDEIGRCLDQDLITLTKLEVLVIQSLDFLSRWAIRHRLATKPESECRDVGGQRRLVI